MPPDIKRPYIALPSTDHEAPQIAKELITLFSHMGVPQETLTDQGANFMSTLLEQDAPIAAYAVEMRDRQQKMTDLVLVNASRAQQKQKAAYDRGTHSRILAEGDRVLVLLPNRQNSIKLEWRGSYKVTRAVTAVDYEIEFPTGVHVSNGRKVYHVNMMKKWHPEPEQTRPVLLILQVEDEEEEDEDVWLMRKLDEDDLYPLGGIGEGVSIED